MLLFATDFTARVLKSRHRRRLNCVCFVSIGWLVGPSLHKGGFYCNKPPPTKTLGRLESLAVNESLAVTAGQNRDNRLLCSGLPVHERVNNCVCLGVCLLPPCIRCPFLGFCTKLKPQINGFEPEFKRI